MQCWYLLDYTSLLEIFCLRGPRNCICLFMAMLFGGISVRVANMFRAWFPSVLTGKPKFTAQNLYVDVQLCRLDSGISPWLSVSFAPSHNIFSSSFISLLPWHLINFVLVFNLTPSIKIVNNKRPKINPWTNPWVTSFQPWYFPWYVQLIISFLNSFSSIILSHLQTHFASNYDRALFW